MESVFAILMSAIAHVNVMLVLAFAWDNPDLSVEPKPDQYRIEMTEDDGATWSFLDEVAHVEGTTATKADLLFTIPADSCLKVRLRVRAESLYNGQVVAYGAWSEPSPPYSFGKVYNAPGVMRLVRISVADPLRE